MSATIELFDDTFRGDPHPAFSALRSDAPVHRVQLPDGPVWLIPRYDVRAALVDPCFSTGIALAVDPAALCTGAARSSGGVDGAARHPGVTVAAIATSSTATTSTTAGARAAADRRPTR